MLQNKMISKENSWAKVSLESLIDTFRNADTLEEKEKVINQIYEIKGKVPVDLVLEIKEIKKSGTYVVQKKKL